MSTNARKPVLVFRVEPDMYMAEWSLLVKDCHSHLGFYGVDTWTSEAYGPRRYIVLWKDYGDAPMLLRLQHGENVSDGWEDYWDDRYVANITFSGRG